MQTIDHKNKKLSNVGLAVLFLGVTSSLCWGQTTGELSRTIVGFEQAGASAASSAQRFFFNEYISVPFPVKQTLVKSDCVPLKQKSDCVPLKQKSDCDFGPRVRLWGDVRITTVPQQITSSIGPFA